MGDSAINFEIMYKTIDEHPLMKVITGTALMAQSLVPQVIVERVWQANEVMVLITPALQFTGLVVGLIISHQVYKNYKLKNQELEDKLNK